MQDKDLLAILTLVEAGHINAQQANALVSAAATMGDTSEEMVAMTQWAAETVREGVSESLHGATARAHTQRRVQLRERLVVLRTTGTRLDIRPYEGADLVVDLFGMPARIVETSDTVHVDMAGAAGRLMVPPHTALNVTAYGSKVDMYDDGGRLQVYATASALHLEVGPQVDATLHADGCALDVRLTDDTDPRVRIDCVLGLMSLPPSWTVDTHLTTTVRASDSDSAARLDVRMTAGLLEIGLDDPVYRPTTALGANTWVS